MRCLKRPNICLNFGMSVREESVYHINTYKVRVKETLLGDYINSVKKDLINTISCAFHVLKHKIYIRNHIHKGVISHTEFQRSKIKIFCAKDNPLCVYYVYYSIIFRHINIAIKFGENIQTHPTLKWKPSTHITVPSII